MSIVVNTKDEIIMQLVHYFVTEESYQPIIVNGVKNEIWLENLDAHYRIIRINSNYIHNIDQLQFDNFKIKNIMKQIKKKTLSLKMNTLNILLDLNKSVKMSNTKGIETFQISDIKDVTSEEGLAKIYPKLKSLTMPKKNSIANLISITNNINNKTEEENKEYERIFKPKKIVVTNILIVLNVILFIVGYASPSIFNALLLNPVAVRGGEYYRLITSAFFHANIIHLALNMYALHIVGNQVETFLGKWKYLIIYILCGISGSLLSCVLTNSLSLGASGAVFGLMGSLLYFGYNYRLYLGNVLINQLVPLIIINLLIGFSTPGIDNAAHIGGLVCGLFSAMALGLGKKTEKSTHINGYITLFIYLGFLVYLLFK